MLLCSGLANQRFSKFSANRPADRDHFYRRERMHKTEKITTSKFSAIEKISTSWKAYGIA